MTVVSFKVGRCQCACVCVFVSVCKPVWLCFITEYQSCVPLDESCHTDVVLDYERQLKQGHGELIHRPNSTLIFCRSLHLDYSVCVCAIHCMFLALLVIRFGSAAWSCISDTVDENLYCNTTCQMRSVVQHNDPVLWCISEWERNMWTYGFNRGGIYVNQILQVWLDYTKVGVA